MCGSKGGGGNGSGPPENLKNIVFLRNTGLDQLKIKKLPSQHSMLGHHWHASETPFKWRFAGGSMIAAYCAFFVFESSLPSKNKTKKKRKVKPPLTKLSGSAHDIVVHTKNNGIWNKLKQNTELVFINSLIV